MDLVSTHEIYVNVCMNSFIICTGALWSAVGLNENEKIKRQKSNVKCLLCLHFRGNRLVLLCDTEKKSQQNYLRIRHNCYVLMGKILVFVASEKHHFCTMIKRVKEQNAGKN